MAAHASLSLSHRLPAIQMSEQRKLMNIVQGEEFILCEHVRPRIPRKKK